ncbi:MAG: hypothetical protein METHP_01547 [Methanoregula sp. SKADARSKE-2]|nr:MAG: hypothetical protein METHP_01547 [Methanoregula sp. SKADARSKE-2]
MSSLCDALSEDRYGTILAIEVSAGAKSDAFPCGYNEWRKTIGCRVSTPPVEGRANKAVITQIASVIQIPASRVTILSGSTSSQKKVHIKGTKKEDLLAILVPLFGKE